MVVLYGGDKPYLAIVLLVLILGCFYKLINDICSFLYILYSLADEKQPKRIKAIYK